MSKSLNIAFAAMMSGAGCEPVAEVPAEVEVVMDEVKKDVDWTCDAYISISSDDRNVTAVHDCTTNVDVTDEIRAIDPSLKAGALYVVDFDPATDKLLLFAEDGGLWAVFGISDVVLEMPNARVTGKKRAW